MKRILCVLLLSVLAGCGGGVIGRGIPCTFDVDTFGDECVLAP